MNTNTVYITKTSLKQNHSHKNIPLSIAYSTILKFSFFIFLFAEKTIKRETANNIKSNTVIIYKYSSINSSNPTSSI